MGCLNRLEHKNLIICQRWMQPCTNCNHPDIPKEFKGELPEEMVEIPRRLLKELRLCIHDCMDVDGDVFEEATEYLNKSQKTED